MIYVRLGRIIQKHLGLYACAAIIAGLIFGSVYRADQLKALIPLALFLMIYPSMLDIEMEKIKRAFAEPKLLLAALCMNFIISPLLIYVLSGLLIEDSPSLLVGLLLYGIVPCGGMIPAFTVMLKGNINLTVAVMVLSLLLSIVIVPFLSKLLIGSIVPVPVFLIIKYLIVIIMVPLLLAELTRRLVIRRRGTETFARVKEYLKILTGYGLMLIMFIVFALKGRQVLIDPLLIPKIMLPVFIFLIILFLCSAIITKAMKSSYEDSIALSLTTSAKNNAIAIALAASAFGTDVALTIAITGPLAQFPLMLGYIRLRRKFGSK